MFVISYEKQDGGYVLNSNVTERTVPSDLVLSHDGSSFYVGCCFDAESEVLFSSGWEKNPSVLNTFCSALYIVHFDEFGCTFATDVSGRELLFYYRDETRFVLSDSFWGILKIVRPSFDKVDAGIVAEMIASGGGVPCDNSTPVKNLYWAPTNCIGRFDAETGRFSFDIFADTKRTCEVASLDDAVESLDESMVVMAQSLASKHSDASFGLGLSGGLDSRIALHYLEQVGIRPKSFNTCVTRPHKIFLASSVLNARNLADAAHADYREVEWRPKSIREKMDAMLQYHPLGTCGHYTNAYKYEIEGIPEFDVLVTAGQAIGPNLVGGSVVSGMENMTEESVHDYLYTICTGDVRPYAYTEGLVRGKLGSMGVSSCQQGFGPHFDVWKAVVSDEVLSSIENRVSAFMESRYERGFTAADIVMDYRTSALGAIGRDGAYESLFGAKKSYTIYTPFLVKEGLRWDLSVVEGRRVLKELIKTKIPEFAHVGEESYGGIGRNSSRLMGSFEKLMFLLRGSGIMADEWYARHPAIRSAFVEDMSNDCAWFYEMFPDTSNFENVWRMSPSRMNSIWALKRLVDCIESKRYLAFD